MEDYHKILTQNVKVNNIFVESLEYLFMIPKLLSLTHSERYTTSLLTIESVGCVTK